MMALDSLVLAVLFGAIFFYILYGVIRAAVRDGILQAETRRQGADRPPFDDSGVRS